MSWLLLLLLAGPASAHDGPPEGLSPFVVDGELTGGGEATGVILVEDGVPTWACEDAFQGTPSHWFLQPDGDVLATSPGGAFVSEDGGCTWSAHADLDARNWFEAARDGDTLYLVSSTPGSANRLVVSEDGGETFAETGVSIDDELLRGVATLDGVVWVLGSRTSDYAPTLRRWDGALSEPLVFEGWRDGRLLLAEDDALWLSMVSPTGRVLLLRQQPDLSAMGTEFAEFFATVTAAVRHDDDLLVTTLGGQLWKGDAGGFAQVEGPALSCLSWIGDELWGCGTPPDDAVFLRSADGQAWTPVLDFDDVQPRACPDDSDYAAECPAAWERVLTYVPREAGDDDDSAGPAPSPCEGCGGGQAWLLLAAVGLRRRR